MNSYYQKLKMASANTGGKYSNLTGTPTNPVVAPTNTLSQLNRTYVVTIVNATTASATYVVGGYNYYGDTNTAGSGTGVTVTTNVLDGTHGALKREMNNFPSTISAVRMTTTSTTNFNNSITYQFNRGSRIVSDQVNPINAQAPTYNQSTIVDLYEFAGVDWNATTLLTGSIASGSTITFAINIGTIISVSNAAQGQNVVKTAIYAPPIQANISPVTLAITNGGTGMVGGGAAADVAQG